jgi:AraC-like DNA-binding protein
MAPGTRVIRSYYHTPSETAKDLFVMALRAGHLRAGPDCRIERRVSAGHDLLLGVKGNGCISTGGRVFPVSPGELAWINGHHPHAHWADRERPWELLWARVDGRSVDQIAAALEVHRAPVFRPPDVPRLATILRSVLRLMRSRPGALEALLHAEITRLLAALFEARLVEEARCLNRGPAVPARIQKAVDDLSLYYYRKWHVPELARDAGMSVPNFFRCFRRATGLTPIDYLRRERINQAKRRLVESADFIKEIAEQVGYLDQFYFSRDFKQHTRQSPTEFRRRDFGFGQH